MSAARPASLHLRILDELRGRILSGAWPPGHRLPPELELSARFGCSRMTMNKVLAQLVQAGLIERRRKAGSFVARPRAMAAVMTIQDVRVEVEALGLAYGYRLLRRDARKAAAADRAALDVPADAPVVALDCLHLAGGRPFCLEHRLISAASVPAALEMRFAEEAPGPWLLANVPWSEARHVIRAANASAEQAKLLDLAPGTACLTVERRTWARGNPVTWVTLTYPGTMQELVAVFTPEE